MPRLTPENVQRAKDLIALYPQTRAALIPILPLAQEQDGWLTPDAMAHVAELVDLAPAEVRPHGTLSRERRRVPAQVAVAGGAAGASAAGAATAGAPSPGGLGLGA